MKKFVAAVFFSFFFWVSIALLAWWIYQNRAGLAALQVVSTLLSAWYFYEVTKGN